MTDAPVTAIGDRRSLLLGDGSLCHGSDRILDWTGLPGGDLKLSDGAAHSPVPLCWAAGRSAVRHSQRATAWHEHAPGDNRTADLAASAANQGRRHGCAATYPARPDRPNGPRTRLVRPSARRARRSSGRPRVWSRRPDRRASSWGGWLEPTTEAILESEGAAGSKRLTIAAPRYSADCPDTSPDGMAKQEAFVRRELTGWY